MAATTSASNHVSSRIISGPGRHHHRRPPPPPRPAVRARAHHSSDVDLSDEWQAALSLGESDEVLMYLNHQHETRRSRLEDVMVPAPTTATPDMTLEATAALLATNIEGLPVVDAADGKLVGVISKKDFSKGGRLVKDVMSSPPISLLATAHVGDAASIMTENHFHRVPVVDTEGRCIGIVTRTDIFWALAQSIDEGEGEGGGGGEGGQEVKGRRAATLPRFLAEDYNLDM